MTHERFLIRLAGESDIALLEATGNGDPEPGYFARCLDSQAKGGRSIYLMTCGDALCGYAMLNWKPRYTLFLRLGIPEIQDLYVVPEYRRQGLAKALIGHCENEARLRDCTHIGIGVGLHAGFGAAQRLYVSLGYVPDGNGICADRETVAKGQRVIVDDDLSLMMLKTL